MTAVPVQAAPRRLGARLLRSTVVDLLLGPHGVDRYLELVRPAMTVADARAEVIARPPPDLAQRDPDPAAQRRMVGVRSRPVRPGRLRDQRRAVHPDLFPGRVRAHRP